QFGAAFRRWGVDVDQEPAERVVARLGEQPKAVVEEIVAGLDEWALARRRAKRAQAEWRRLSAVADRLDGDPRRRELRRLREGGALQQERDAAPAARGLGPWLGAARPVLGPGPAPAPGPA